MFTWQEATAQEVDEWNSKVPAPIFSKIAPSALRQACSVESRLYADEPNYQPPSSEETSNPNVIYL